MTVSWNVNYECLEIINSSRTSSCEDVFYCPAAIFDYFR